MDPSAVEVGNGEVATVVFAVGDALGDALVRPGCVVAAPGIQSGRRADGPPGGSARGPGAHGAGRRSSPLRPAPSLVRETGSAARPGQKQRH